MPLISTIRFLTWLLVDESRIALEQIDQQQKSIRNLRFAIWMKADVLAKTVGRQSVFETVAKLQPGLKAGGRQWLVQQLKNGNARLVLDALDEVSDRHRTKLKEALEEFNGFEKARAVASSRLAGYERAPFTLNSEEDEVELLAFDTSQTDEAIIKYFDPNRDAAAVFQAHVRENWTVREILRSPLLLKIACEAAIQFLAQRKDLPQWETRTDLYGTLLNHSVERFRKRATGIQWDETDVLGSFLDIVADMSLRLLLQDSRRTFWSHDDVSRTLRAARVSNGEKNRPNIPDLVKSEILVPAVPGSAGALMFTHRTIGEYLASRELALKLQMPDAAEWHLVDKKAWDPRWIPTLLFLAGRLAESSNRNAASTVEHLLKMVTKPPSDPYRDDDFMHRHTQAAQMLAEIPAKTRTKIANRVNAITEAVFARYWGLLQSVTLEAISGADRAWWVLGQVNGRLGGAHLQDTIVKRLEDGNPTVRITAVAAIGRWVTHGLRIPRAVEPVLALFCNPDKDVRRRAVEAVGNWGEGTESEECVRDAILALFSDPDSRVHGTAVEAVGRWGDLAFSQSQVLDAVLALFSDPDSTVPARVVEAVGKWGDRAFSDVRIVQGVLRLFSDASDFVRGSAAWAVGSWGEGAFSDRRIVEGVLKLFSDPDDYVRGQAVDTVGRWGERGFSDERIVQAVLAIFHDPDKYVSWSAVVAGGRWEDRALSQPRAREAVLALLSDARDYVRGRAAYYIVGHLRDRALSQPRILKAVLTLFSDASWYVRFRAVEAVGCWGGRVLSRPRVLNAVLALFSDPACSVRAVALRVVGHWGECALSQPLVLEAVRALLDDDDSYVRESAAQTFAQFQKVGARFFSTQPDRTRVRWIIDLSDLKPPPTDKRPSKVLESAHRFGSPERSEKEGQIQKQRKF